MANTLKKIQTIIVGSGGASSISFTSIPQTYTDLVIYYSGRTTSTSGDWSDVWLRPNGSSTNGTERYVQGAGSGAATGATNSYIDLRTNTANTTANTFSSYQVYICNYTSSNNKSMSIEGVTENNGTTALAHLSANLWSSSSAITSIDLVSNSGNLAQYTEATLYGISNANTTAGGSGKATGGNQVYTDGTYWYHVFTSDGNFVPSTAMNVDYLVVAGGGSGGSRIGGGGGAGGYRTSVGTSGGNSSAESVLSVTAQTYAITVGAGGAAVTSTPGVNGNSGSNSVFGSITSTGGGGGGAYVGGTANQGLTGGSGGGSSYQNTTAGTGTASQGSNGGAGATGVVAAGGGGGASAVGGNAVATNAGGAGGAGLSSSITGTSVTRAGGGGGSGSGSAGAGGSGGGGAGATLVANATAASANTGSGGGGARNEYDSAGVVSGAGGSGIVIVRYAA